MPFRLTRPEPLESQVLRAVLHALSVHPKVARAWRNNTGSGHLKRGDGASQYIRFGFKGSPDIHGFMCDGRALYVECKRPITDVSPEQRLFLDEARRYGCVAFVARSVDDVFSALGQPSVIPTFTVHNDPSEPTYKETAP